MGATFTPEAARPLPLSDEHNAKCRRSLRDRTSLRFKPCSEGLLQEEARRRKAAIQRPLVSNLAFVAVACPQSKIQNKNGYF
jgi:hypothetical protein